MTAASRFLISCSEDTTIKVWDCAKFEQNRCERTLLGHGQIVNSIKMWDERTLVSCSDDKTIRMWHIDTGECVYTIEDNEKLINLTYVTFLAE